MPSEADIPIDIAVRKLLDWLISRRLCQKDWHQKVTSIRTLVGQAMRDMPEHEGIKALLTGSHINYFHCTKIVELLKETEADTKNFFGQYSSQRMKDWKEIITLYQADNLYLAEAAQLLSQNIVYEIPGLKKSLAKCDAVSQECDKKQEQSYHREKELMEEYNKECEDLGIQGNNIRAEILELAKQLPTTYEEIAEQAKELQEAAKVYEEFMKGLLDEGCDDSVLVNLKFLIEHGNVTTYQWKYGEKPITVEEPQIVFDEDTMASDAGEIDFGDGEIDFGDGGEIDFGDSGAEIDFGEEIDFGDVTSGDAIDFSAVSTCDIVVTEGGLQGGVARDCEALTLLDNRRTRANIIDELEELAGFLTQRLCEVSSSSSKYSLVSSGTAAHSEDSLRSMIHGVEAVASALSTPKVRQLQGIRGSPATVNRILDRLNAKRKQVDKVAHSRHDLEARRQAAALESKEATHQLKVLGERSKELQENLQREISERYKGRRVNITGVTG